MMKKRRRSSKRSKSKNEELSKLTLLNPNAAGIDVGASQHWVSVPTEQESQNVRSFGYTTSELYALADWLEECGIETVAMESTGVYWIPLFQILEAREFEVFLVNARHVKTVPGRKSDVLDCQWLQQLHTYGLLSASFRPEAQICELRSYLRHRDSLTRSASSHIQRMQKALIQMNIHLHRVMSDITGDTGMAIIRAIIKGERDPYVLAGFRHYRMKRSEAEIAQALMGDYRPEHVFVLRQELQLYDAYQTQIAECDKQIEQCLSLFEDRVALSETPIPRAKKKYKKSRGQDSTFDLRTHLYRITGVDFTQVDGFEVLTVQTILSEVGLDAGRFPTVKHFCSWLGLCPGSKITGGKSISSKSRKVVSKAAQAFRMAAYNAGKSNSAIGAFYRRIRSRLGAPKAVTATAHKLARIFYHLWKNGGQYTDLGADYYEQRYRERMLKNLRNNARKLGVEIVEIVPQSS